MSSEELKPVTALQVLSTITGTLVAYLNTLEMSSSLQDYACANGTDTNQCEASTEIYQLLSPIEESELTWEEAVWLMQNSEEVQETAMELTDTLIQYEGAQIALLANLGAVTTYNGYRLLKKVYQEQDVYQLDLDYNLPSTSDLISCFIPGK